MGLGAAYSPAMLVGRDPELAVLTAALDDARRGRSGCLVVRGPEGIGKSALLDALVERAGPTPVLRTTCASTESGLPFVGLADLLRPVQDRLAGLPSQDRAALASALALGPAEGGDRFAVPAAVLCLLAEKAADTGLLVAVDDGHWLDAASADALLLVARRLGAEGVLVVVTVRTGDGARGPVEAAGLPTLDVQGLPAPACAQLLTGSGASVDADVLRALVSASQGNPLAVQALANSLTSAQLQGHEPLPDRLPVGPRLRAALTSRTAALPDGCRSALLLAALATTGRAPVLAAALASLGLSVDDLLPAVDAGLVELDADVLRFRSPLLRSALPDVASPAERRRCHAALAAALSGDDAGSVERRAAHLVEASVLPDESVARAVELAARSAASRRAFGTAFELHSQAARLSTDSGARVGRLLQAAAAAVPAGRPEQAAAALDAALPEVADAGLLVDLQHQRARIAMWSSEAVPARERLVALAEQVAPSSPQRAVRLLVDAALGAFASRDSTAADAVVARLVPLRDAAERPEAIELLQALSVLQSGDQAVGAALLRRCESFLAQVDPIAPDQLLLIGAACHLALDEPLAAAALLRRATAAAREASALGLLVFQLTWLSAAEVTAGHWDAAYAQAGEALRLAQDIGWRVHLPTCLATLARVEALSGREQAREHAEQARASAGGTGAVAAYAAWAVGLLELGRGRPAQAAPHFEEALRSSRAGGQGGLVVAQFLPDLVEAHVRCGRDAEAAALAQELVELAERTGRRSTRAAAARCRGLLGSGEQAELAFEEALRWNAQVADPFDRARTELYLGEHLRRRKRRSAARAPLAAAERILSQLGAGPWAERARTELSLAGGSEPPARAPGLRELTAQELQVALAVADGQSNAEVARSLFLSVKTIEFHLSNAYRKLGLRSRSALAGALADGQLVTAGRR